MALADRSAADVPRPHPCWRAHVVVAAGARSGAPTRWPVTVDGSLLGRHGVSLSTDDGGRLVSMQIVAGTRQEAIDIAARRWFYLADDLDLQTLTVQIEVEELT